MKSPQIDFEVCGTEAVAVTGDSEYTYPLIYHDAHQTINGETFIRTRVDQFVSKFQSDPSATACKVTEWEFYDSDSNDLATNTLLTDTQNHKM